MEDFPDEILLNVLSRLHRSPELANVSLTCNRLNQLVAQSLADSKLYNSIHFGKLQLNGDNLTPQLHNILKHPALSRYVLNASLQFTDDYDDDNQNNDVEDIGSDMGVWNILQKAGEELGVYDRKFNEERDSIKSCTGARAAFLLLMHRNLEVLEVAFQNTQCKDWIRWLVCVASLGPFPASLASYPTFHALREVSYLCTCRRIDCRFEFADLEPYLYLPSIEKISADMVISEYNDFEYKGTPGVSKLTELSFQRSVLSTDEIEQFLLIPKSLKRFAYSYGGRGDGGFDRDKILAVVKRTQPSLEDANIELIDESDHDDTDSQDDEEDENVELLYQFYESDLEGYDNEYM